MAERYEILGKLARGGIGAIYRARDKVMGREVALKRLLPIEETHLNEAADESLQREAAALARFQHPNVVTIFAFEEDEEGSYVAMELVDGENLKETVERGALAVDDFTELTLQTLDPFVAAKDMDLMHRDIKPSNIMLTWLPTRKFQVKVLDFGLAKFSQAPSTQTLDQTGSFLGSIDYLAPEQLELAPLDQRTDLYSLGCVLYYCLTQKPPFEGKNAAETMNNHLRQKVKHLNEYRQDVPKPVAEWVMRMISRYPNQRPADAREALKEFQAALKGESPPTPAAPEKSAAVAIVESDDLPVAKRVEDPVPTAPKLNTPASRAAKEETTTASRMVTGAVSPSTRAKATTEPRKIGTAAATARPPGVDLRNRILVIVGSAVSACLMFYFFIYQPEDDGDPGEVRTHYPVPPIHPKGDGGKSKAAPKPDRNLPPLKNPATLDGVVAAPPGVTEGLVAHYAASDAAIGANFKFGPETGSMVKAWGNLAEDATRDHLLAVMNQDQAGPNLVTATPEVHPELKQATPVLRFKAGNQFVSTGNPANKLSRPELTLVTVLRSTSGGGTLIRFDTPTGEAPLLKMEITGGGGTYQTVMDRGSLQPTTATRIAEAKGKFLIFTTIWTKDVQRHFLRLPNGDRIYGPAGDAPWRDPPKPDSYTLCQGVSADVAEVLIYNRTLPDSDREMLEDQLFEKYFRPDFPLDHTAVSALPDGKPAEIQNPKPVAPSFPSPPVTDGLTAHYAATDGTLGIDLRSPTPADGRVFAWANLAPGAAADHLLAFKKGHEYRTPRLKGGPSQRLAFAPGNLLESRGSQTRQKIDKRQFSGFLVLKPDGKIGPVFQMDADRNDGVFALFRNADGIGSRMKSGGKNTSESVSKIPQDQLSIVSFSWNGADKQHRVFVRQADGEAIPADPAAGPAGPLIFSRYRIGVVPPQKKPKNTAVFGGEVAELLLFGRALDEAERKQVEDFLHGRYFKN